MGYFYFMDIYKVLDSYGYDGIKIIKFRSYEGLE